MSNVHHIEAQRPMLANRFNHVMWLDPKTHVNNIPLATEKEKTTHGLYGQMLQSERNSINQIRDRVGGLKDGTNKWFLEDKTLFSLFQSFTVLSKFVRYFTVYNGNL